MSERSSWAIYDTATGEIIYVVRCRDEQLAAQVRPGQSAWPCEPDLKDSEHRVDLESDPPAIVPIG